MNDDVTAVKGEESSDALELRNRSRVARVLLWLVLIDAIAILVWAGLAFAC